MNPDSFFTRGNLTGRPLWFSCGVTDQEFDSTKALIYDEPCSLQRLTYYWEYLEDCNSISWRVVRHKLTSANAVLDGRLCFKIIHGYAVTLVFTVLERLSKFVKMILPHSPEPKAEVDDMTTSKVCLTFFLGGHQTCKPESRAACYPLNFSSSDTNKCG